MPAFAIAHAHAHVLASLLLESSSLRIHSSNLKETLAHPFDSIQIRNLRARISIIELVNVRNGLDLDCVLVRDADEGEKRQRHRVQSSDKSWRGEER